MTRVCRDVNTHLYLKLENLLNLVELLNLIKLVSPVIIVNLW